jgi:hypothetical protein
VLAVALHGELLQIGGEALQVLIVGQNRDRLRAEEIRCTRPEQAQEDGQVAREGGGAEMLVHLVKAASISRKLSGPIASMVDSPMAESIE